MKSKPIISVIVPIHNVGEYLSQCIESIINQSFKDIEIILVNDGSTDDSLSICTKYKNIDKRIRLINKPKNKGLVAARKTELNESRGEYAIYIDADDWIKDNYFEELYKIAKKHSIQAVFPNHIREFMGATKIIKNKIKSGLYNSKEIETLILPHIISFGKFFSHGITSYSWGKLFLLSKLKEYQLNIPNNIVMGEDAALLFTITPNIESLFITDLAGYFYRQRPGSILKTIDSHEIEAKRLSALYRFLFKSLSKYSSSFGYLKQLDDYFYALLLIRIGSYTINGYNPIFESLKHQNINQRSKVVLFSSGSFGQNIYKNSKSTGSIKICCWIDEDFKESQLCGLPVLGIKSVHEIDYEYIFIATLDPDILSIAK